MKTSQYNKIFFACCLSLVVTAMTFAIRAGILGELSEEFAFSDTQLGWINSMAFLGFPLATMIGGIIYNQIGAKKLLLIAVIGHLLGLILTIFAGGFWSLLISTFCIGFANGSVEAGANPLIADIYHDDKTTMLNRFHVWFPGGIVIGALIAFAMTRLGIAWQWQIAVMLIPTVIYGYLVSSQAFPSVKNSETSTATNFRSLFSPLYIFMLVCMTLTSTAELGTQQWVERILGDSGAHPMLILAMVTGLMAIGRYFAGPVVHLLNPAGVLLAGSVIATAGIYLMSVSAGGMVYFSALLFAIGVMYFWPTMLGFVSEYQAKTGAMGLSLIGGLGMFSVSIWNPIIGRWLDTAREQALAQGVSIEAADLIAGQATLTNLAIFPGVLIVLFSLLFLYTKRKQQPLESNLASKQAG
ncbi:MAG: MFS transporter [Cellvibrionaceae bacterium]|nr:MFS transporter [Cellvibrionaceae bacterium]